MRLVLLGPPGSGKGTQALRLKNHFQVPHISTGDLLRAEVAAGTALGNEAKVVMARGELVSDAILLGMLEQRLTQPDVKNGFILDGYPRNSAQADALGVLLEKIQQPLNAVLEMNVPIDLLTERLAGRAEAEGRTDDNPKSIRKRLQIYADATEPLISFYQQKNILCSVDGVGEMDEVFSRILNSLNKQ